MAADITTGLIAHLRLDETSGTTAHDSTGNGIDAVFLTTPTWSAGRIGGCANQINDGLSIGTLQSASEYPSLNTNPWSFAWWQKSSAFTVGPMTAWTNAQDCNLNWATNGNITLYTEDDVGVVDVLTADGQWHHWCLTSDGTYLKFYRDGAFKGQITSTQPAATIDLDGPGTVGDNLARDDIRIYSRALTAEDVAALAAPASGETSSLSPSLTSTLTPPLTGSV